ncbi:HLH DNA binding domain protein, putative [Paecilomyces variotii No. 5]|uniref:HLH DNA binding domain protein, putative n=1 Tax=Byssochlamys spectabilis (strain No. 5 / NBRC 109023) TaxID=1356009 RepID=V5I3D6_BYSSN|nr:HLH DNA binding domain protein, putative [Paecilomyces variotii No. 5]
MDNYSHGMLLNRHSLDMSPCFEDRMSLADIEFPTLAEHYFLDADTSLNDTDLFRWGATEDQFAFDLSMDPSMNNTATTPNNAKAAFYQNQLNDRHLSCGSLFSDLDSEGGSLSLIQSGSSLSPVLSDLDSQSHHTPLASPASLRREVPATPEKITASYPVVQPTTMSPRAISECSDLPSPMMRPAQAQSTKSSSSKSSQRAPRTSHSSDDTKDTAASKRKAAHNAVEKRYRTNMNAKFMALGNAIPSLRANKSNTSMNSKGIKTNLKDGTQTQNKSEVLTKALAYIQELQEEKYMLQNELSVLKDNLLPRNVWSSSRRREA